jgi:hypothetical protein
MPLTPIKDPQLTNDRASIAYHNLILATRVGSEVHGINIPGTDDHDEMAVFIEPPEVVLGLDPPLDHVIERTRGNGERSQPGDIDRTLYSLRKYMNLAVKGNPTVLLPLWAHETDILHITLPGLALRRLRHHFLSQEAAWRFLGYCKGQRDRVLGQGRRSAVPNRPELIEQYGWDVKYGSHALRLALQCRQLILSGVLILPMRDEDRELVLRVKTGEFSRSEVVQWINTHIAECERIIEEGRSALPEKPNRPLLSTVATQTHLDWWKDHQHLR